MPEDQMTQILVAESQEKALKNVTVISHKFLVHLSWDGPHACDRSRRDGLQACDKPGQCYRPSTGHEVDGLLPLPQ